MERPGNKTTTNSLNIASFAPLDLCQIRQICPLCNQSRKYYCYSCLTLIGLNENDVPRVTLPLECHIIKHIDERDGKNTAVQAYLLSKDVSLFTYPGMIPPYTSNGDVVVCFPYEHALPINQFVDECVTEQRPQPKIVLFLDGTWSNVQQIAPLYAHFPAVKLTHHDTLFWRTHLKHIPNTFLSTIEAIYHFFVEFTQNLTGVKTKEFDNILYFFMHQLSQVLNSDDGKNTNTMKCVLDDELKKYLTHTYKSHNLDRICRILAIPPKWTTLRVNQLKSTRDEVITSLTSHFQSKSERYSAICHPLLSDVITIEGIKQASLKKHQHEVIIDLKCAKSVLRGADIYAPGVKGLPHIKSGSLVSVCVDVLGKCKKGEKHFKGEVIHIANGTLELTRFVLFKKVQLKGVAVTITETFVKSPSLNGVLPGEIILQNIPSIVVCHALDPQPSDIILDMCSAPGGKTTHLASLMGDKGTIIALEKNPNKVKRMREDIQLQRITSITLFVCDSTACFSEAAPSDSLCPPFGRERFDRILLDPPCSALGQRPMLVNNSNLKDVISHPSYQWCFVADAVKMLRSGGVLVYSTCTLPLQENEGIVARVLKEFPFMELVKAEPAIGQPGISVGVLSEEECDKVQRFDPLNCKDDVGSDTIGFFIAKFIKL